MLIAIDWGTSNLRVFLIDETGNIQAEKSNNLGVVAVSGKQFIQTLQALINDWLEKFPKAPILMCGMVGSNQGWLEVPYINYSGDLSHLSHQLISLPEAESAFNRVVKIVPGLKYCHNDGLIDVMRGEETQLIGAMNLRKNTLFTNDEFFCLPGTHSKWLWVKENRMESFATSMTGEFFSLLKNHSLLGSLLKPASQAFYPKSFIEGVKLANLQGGVLHHLFSARTQLLFSRIPFEEGSDYLSGILVGHECRAMIELYSGLDHLLLVGSDGLLTRYEKACNYFNIATSRMPGNQAVAQGLFYLAKEGRLI